MNNVLLIFINIIVSFTIVVLIEKIFKKEGLYVWAAIALIMANILECQTVGLFNGFTSTCGNVLFASVFLATDIMSEKYGSEYSKKAIKLAVLAMISFTIIMQIGLLFTPDASDFAHDSMVTLFSLNLRITISSLVMFYISNNLDIFLFDKLKKKLPKQLWLRNNVATIISNVLENYFFIFFAFVGIYDVPTMLNIATTISVVEIVIAIFDTPFLYISKKLN
ncbi:MAG: queuosine precursor transporter [Bacilli bacterium]|nr:queuosine precursor transporter [Bacilli bacterium]